MEHFRSSKEYREIKKEFERLGMMDAMMNFQCLVDGLMEYSLEEDGVKHVFTLWAEDENFVWEMEVSWLLDLKRVRYFRHDIYTVTGSPILKYQLADSKEFRMINEHELN